MTSSQLVCVDPGRVQEILPHVSHMLRSAIDKVGVSDWNEIEGQILAGNALVWIAWNGGSIQAAAATALNKIGRELICTIIACGGEDRNEWLPLITGIEAFAVNEGCEKTRIVGRKAWGRVLPDYREKCVVLEKVHR